MLILATTPVDPAVQQEMDAAPPSLDELVTAFVDMPVPETTALLAALGVMLSEGDAMRARCRQAVGERRHRVPSWLAELDRTTVHRAVRMTHALDDGEELLLGVRFADGQEMTCVVNIDRRKTSAINDAFFVPSPLDAVLTVAEAANTDPDTTFEGISRAEARADLHEALAQPLSLAALRDSDTWPSCRALVQWLSRLMPHG